MADLRRTLLPEKPAILIVTLHTVTLLTLLKGASIDNFAACKDST